MGVDQRNHLFAPGLPPGWGSTRTPALVSQPLRHIHGAVQYSPWKIMRRNAGGCRAPNIAQIRSAPPCTVISTCAAQVSPHIMQMLGAGGQDPRQVGVGSVPLHPQRVRRVGRRRSVCGNGPAGDTTPCRMTEVNLLHSHASLVRVPRPLACPMQQRL